ncbi:hypothetical protein SACC_26730 [Saccharolobus caldissimus]|uniref:Uncharacterized protein n=1 Tax=Saccharolobus caldissimus TaxID=1702097 RepID=A0AAQ4CV25_9CREN|nr:hypothetical protein SACC_26730 [Saccharolobus caldissimus]
MEDYINACFIVAGAASAIFWVSYFHLILLGLIALSSSNTFASDIFIIYYPYRRIIKYRKVLIGDVSQYPSLVTNFTLLKHSLGT